MESDAKKLAELTYGYKIDEEKFDKENTKIKEKYKEQKDEFALLFNQKLVNVAMSNDDYELAIEALGDFVYIWKYDVDEQSIEKTNEQIKITQKYISKIERKNDRLTPDDIDDLKDIKKSLQSIIDKMKEYSLTESSSSEDWDAILVAYEQFIDKYIASLKKVKAGDMSAMSEYADYMEKATDLAEKMEGASDELTTAQAAKFAKLQIKLANAAAELD
jgi:hypothetical protein